ncbi:hypothetical protein T478_0496 [Candidatus Nitrosopelagicus brevis]|uniref:Uncharacterized protein n=1 Tax=Candidatus Nitrosopelagicus brevis TaxID=1410606 RepID=A0A0A7V2C4_9ARCH|nr:hypothetical protein T478_0496 [Candidatus Nitrosopelagicus brevis]
MILAKCKRWSEFSVVITSHTATVSSSLISFDLLFFEPSL